MQIFKNRIDAGEKLTALLADLKDPNTIILGLPRGGVIVAKEVAHTLDLPLDIIVTRKIGAPGNDEYAIGAIDLDGEGVWNEEERSAVDNTWLTEKIEREKKEALRRSALYRDTRPPLDLHNKTAIIVDDGIATGMTMRAAVHYTKKLGAQKIIVAVPVAPPSAIEQFKDLAEIRALELPSFFSAVGEWYEEFTQVEDQEVIDALALKK